MSFLVKSGIGAKLTMLGATSATSQLTAVTSNASADTKGSYVELSSSTPHDAQGLIFFGYTTANAAERDCLIDIAIGAASSEIDIVSNLYFSGRDKGTMAVQLPIFVAAGSRLSVRHQANLGNTAMSIGVALLQDNYVGLPVFQEATTYGANTADSGAVSVDPGGSANTKGAYSEITSSTSGDHEALLVIMGYGGNGAPANARFLYDLAYGAAASEVIIIPDFFIMAAQDLAPCEFPMQPFYAQVASGTRIAIRAQCSITNATDRLLDYQVIGFN